jgi:hypothetical protein
MAEVVLFCLCVSVVTATPPGPYSIIEQGASVFIGEEGLNITHALNAAYGYSDPDGYPAPATIGWWASGYPGNPSFTPSVTINLTERYTDFLVSPADFEGYTGTWWAVVPGLAGSDQVRGVAFMVQDPSLDIKIYEDSKNDVTDTSVPRGTRLQFNIETNMYPSVDYAYRNSGGIPYVYGYIDIKVKDSKGVIYTSLLNDSIGTPNAGPNTILDNLVDTSPWTWGDAFGYSWDTAALLDTIEQISYPAGTYTVWAESTLHGMKDNYKDPSGADYIGKTFSQMHTVTIANTGKAAAVDYIVNTYLKGNSDGNGKQEVLVSDSEIPANSPITLLDGTTIISPEYPTWLGFLDEDKNANWGHLCRIVFYADGQDPVESVSDMPPVGIEMSHAAGKFANPSGMTSIIDPPIPDPICQNPVATNNYALLIAGGGTKETNYARYYNDIKFMYNTLVTDYKYDKSRIRVLMSDGLDDAPDQFDKYNTDGSKHYINSEQNLDGVAGDDVNGAADWNNVTTVLTNWASLTSSQTLLIFTTGHGEKITTNSDPSTNQVNLLLWSSSPYSSTEKITDSDFASYLPPNAKISMMMEQCYSGGFKNNVITGTKIRALATAAQGNQVSHSNDFSYPWITGVAWHDSASTPNWVNADIDNNGLISTYEAFTYANAHDPSGPPPGAGTETPTFNYYGAGNSLYPVACGSTTKSITNVRPSTTPWTGGGTGTVRWSSLGLTGINVRIDLMKGEGEGVPVAVISSSKAATLGTASWTVPAVLDSGAGSDYWIKISTIGSLRPPVIGKSSTFQINSVSATSPATLTINSDDVSLIDITNSQGQTVYIDGVAQNGFTTPHTFTPLTAGTYLVKVSRTCTVPMMPQSVTLGSGAVQTKTYPLSTLTDCENVVFGSISITSEPQEGYHVYLKQGTDPATPYTDMGYETPTIANVEPGVYTVRLEADGYEPGELIVTVLGDDTVYADFVLIPSDTQPPAITHFVATPNPAPVRTPIELTATIDDSASGGSTIDSAEYSPDNGVSWIAMDAVDGVFDSDSENVKATATFSTPGVYTLKMRTTDVFGYNAESGVEFLLIVYDPGAGFVTGGGWITSPAGAYPAQPEMTGRATFGFVSKYLKGAKKPTGTTEFQFRTADLNFKSRSYEWLVVAGPKAQFKGVGTINGQGRYGFMLTATDGALKGGHGTDTFRIKIWDKQSNEIIYDNELGTSDSVNPTTAIGGGSIIIHTGK